MLITKLVIFQTCWTKDRQDKTENMEMQNNWMNSLIFLDRLLNNKRTTEYSAIAVTGQILRCGPYPHTPSFLLCSVSEFCNSCIFLDSSFSASVGSSIIQSEPLPELAAVTSVSPVLCGNFWWTYLKLQYFQKGRSGVQLVTEGTYVLNSCQFVYKCLNRSIQGVNLITRSRYHYKLHLPLVLIRTVSYQLRKVFLYHLQNHVQALREDYFKTGSAVFLLTL